MWCINDTTGTKKTLQTILAGKMKRSGLYLSNEAVSDGCAFPLSP